MRRWLAVSLGLMLLVNGCRSGGSGGSGGTAESDIRQQNVPVPEAAQDQDTIPPLPGFPPAAEVVPPSQSAEGAPGTMQDNGAVVYGPPPPPLRLEASPQPVPSVEPSPSPAPSPAAKKPTADAKAGKAKASAKPRDAAPLEPERTKARQASGGKQQITLSELRKKHADSFIFQGNRASRKIALTFDDAPDTVFTPKVLDILKKHQVKATFFVVGYRAVQHPEVVKRIAREGHVIGNHSYGHTLLRKLPQPKFIQEIQKSEQVLSPLAGYSPRLVRPPYGAINDEELTWLKDNGYLTVNWNVDPEDWRGFSKETIRNRALEAAGPGAIILMHSATGDGGSLQGTVDALPEIIEGLRGKGYELVPLTELLNTRKSK